MKKLIGWGLRIVFFVSVMFILIVLRELYVWYLFFSDIGIWVGFAYLLIMVGATGYFIVLPIVRILMLPSFGFPETSDDPRRRHRARVRRAKIMGLKRGIAIKANDSELDAFIEAEIPNRRRKAAEVRRNYVVTTFIGTAVSQSAVIDLYVVVSSSLKLVWKTLEIYGGRTPFRDLANILRDVVVSGAIGASEAAELGSELMGEALPKLAAKIPFVDMIADGYVNAYMVCRIGLITENYCTITLAEGREHWRPGAKAISLGTWDILRGSKEMIATKLNPMVGKVFTWMMRKPTPQAALTIDEESEKSFWLEFRERATKFFSY